MTIKLVKTSISKSGDNTSRWFEVKTENSSFEVHTYNKGIAWIYEGGKKTGSRVKNDEIFNAIKALI